MDRSWVAGVRSIEVLLSYLITHSGVLVGQTLIVLLFMNVVFQTPCNGPVILLIVLSLLQGFGGMCYGNTLQSYIILDSYIFFVETKLYKYFC